MWLEVRGFTGGWSWIWDASAGRAVVWSGGVRIEVGVNGVAWGLPGQYVGKTSI